MLLLPRFVIKRSKLLSLLKSPTAILSGLDSVGTVLWIVNVPLPLLWYKRIVSSSLLVMTRSTWLSLSKSPLTAYCGLLPAAYVKIGVNCNWHGTKSKENRMKKMI